MYSYEIKQLLEMKQYLLTVEDYLNICDNSPQITRVKYDGFNNTFEIWTKDDYYLKFKVRRK